jgi:hypothetical protein
LPPVAAPPIRVILLLAEVRDDLLQDALDLALAPLEEIDPFEGVLSVAVDDVCQGDQAIVYRVDRAQKLSFGFQAVGRLAHIEALAKTLPNAIWWWPSWGGRHAVQCVWKCRPVQCSRQPQDHGEDGPLRGREGAGRGLSMGGSP